MEDKITVPFSLQRTATQSLLLGNYILKNSWSCRNKSAALLKYETTQVRCDSSVWSLISTQTNSSSATCSSSLHVKKGTNKTQMALQQELDDPGEIPVQRSDFTE